MSRLLLAYACLSLVGLSAAAEESNPPAVGDAAPALELAALDGETVKLSELTDEGPVVLLVLRGFPGYQCPLCRKQTVAFMRQAEAFREAGASVVMVYPGDVNDLSVKALEFLGNQKLPAGFQMVLDPDYKFTNAWGLRWDAPKETAYPSTFVIGKDGKVAYAKVSKSHGGRTNPDEVLKALEEAK